MFTNLHLKGSTLHYGQKYLRKVMSGEITFNEKEIKFVREPDNPYDANAVAIWWKSGNEAQKLGYVDRNQAEIIARCMDHRGLVFISSHRIYGSADTNYGLYLGTEVIFMRDINEILKQKQM